MVKSKAILIRVSPDQAEILRRKAQDAGYLKVSEYVRTTLFLSLSTEQKIDKIYEKVCT